MCWALILSISVQGETALDTIASWTERSSSMLSRLPRRRMPDSVPKIVRLSWARRIKQRVTNFDDQNFDGHVTTELGVVRLVDDAHTAFAYLCDDFVATKFCARGNRHEAPINL